MPTRTYPKIYCARPDPVWNQARHRCSRPAPAARAFARAARMRAKQRALTLMLRPSTLRFLCAVVAQILIARYDFEIGSKAMHSKISVDGVGKIYTTEQGTLHVLDSISLHVGDGEIVAIVGPSGCGKSTLMNIIAGFDRPDRGSVSVDGVEQTKPSSRGILISQAGSVFPWLTVQQNLMFGLNGREHAEKKQLADHYAEMVGLKGFEARYPHELSGGMLKRAELARGAGGKPEILYMDEPFSALDALPAPAHAQRATENPRAGTPHGAADHARR